MPSGAHIKFEEEWRGGNMSYEPYYDTLPGTAIPAREVARPTCPERFLVHENGRVLIIRCAQVDWIEADARHCILHFGKEKHRVAGPFHRVAARLSQDQFLRASRFSIVNIERIAHLYMPSNNGLVVQMRNGDTVEISRRFRRNVIERLES